MSASAWVARWAPSIPAGEVLDLACGSGRHSHLLAAPGHPDVVYLEHLTSALYLDDRKDVDHYMEVMNRLSAEAHTPVATTRFLKEIMQEM